MVDNTKIEISTNLKDDLERLATEKNTNIDNAIKLLMVENENLKITPATFYDTTKVSSKENKNSKGEVTSHSYSTAIPKPILNKLGLQKGQLLYWDIDETNKIVITPEVLDLPEEASIQAGNDILNDMLINGNTSKYTVPYNFINEIIKKETPKDNKVNELTENYKQYSDNKDYTTGFKKVVSYLLDYPLTPEAHEILKEAYEEITKTG